MVALHHKKAIPNISPLSLKMLRESKAMLGQIIAIAFVIAAGVMVLIISVSTRQSILLSQQQFYQQSQFAELFAEVTRAPDDLIRQLREMPGVNLVETRVRVGARMQLEGFPEPIQGEVVSLPDYSAQLLNRLHLLSGTLPATGQHEVVISAPFAEAHELTIGDSISAILNGRLQPLRISGVALSPEYIYQLGSGSLLPDYERFGVFWMSRQALASAFDMDGAFNSVSLTLQQGADEALVKLLLDDLLARYGSRGAYTRYDQVSHRFLSEELDQLKVMSIVLPVIFISVAAFLLHVLLTRIIATQRQSIALLKAFGYSTWQIIGHFAQLTLLILTLGCTIGVLLGWLVAEPMAALYATYFRFPEFQFAIRLDALALAISVTATAGFLATVQAVKGAATMAPAEAMRPPKPVSYKPTLIDHASIRIYFSQPTRIMLRSLLRYPTRALLSIIGIGLSGGLILLSNYQFNAVDQMLNTQYRQLYLMDIELTFTEPRAGQSLSTLKAMPGVQYAEGFRQVPVRIEHERKQWRVQLLGIPANGELRKIGTDPLELPESGVAMTRYLADDLGLRPGDSFDVEVLEGRQQHVQLTIAHVIDEPMGLGVYMQQSSLNRLLFEQNTISGAWLLYDHTQEAELFEALHNTPMIASIGQISRAEADIRGYIKDTVLGVMAVMFVLAGSITFAVVYNNARILFAERARELGTLRVLGFSKGEILRIVMSELGLLVLLAIPVGWALGTLFAWLMTMALSMDLFRIPFVLHPQSFAFSALGVLIAAVFSMLLMVRRVWNLDMIQSLKTE